MDALPTPVQDRFTLHGVEDVVALLARRSRAVGEAAPLKAFREAFSSLRDVERAKVAASIRYKLSEAGEKALSEAKLESLANADPRFSMWLDEAQLKLARLIILEDEISALTERVRARDADVRYLTSEARMG